MSLRTFMVFYNGAKREVQASCAYEAQKLGAELLNVPEKRRYQIAVVLADVPVDTASL